MTGVNYNSTKLFEAVKLIRLREALPGVNCRVISRAKNSLSCGSQSLLPSSREINKPHEPHQSRGGTGTHYAIIYSFRSRCLPFQKGTSGWQVSNFEGGQMQIIELTGTLIVSFSSAFLFTWSLLRGFIGLLQRSIPQNQLDPSRG